MKKFMISLLTAMLVLVFCTCTASARSFSDVPSSHWAYNYIEEAVEKGFVNGVGSGKYDPNGQISNAQFITMMTRAFAKDKLPQGNSNSSASSQWWEPYLKTAYDNRFLNGMTAGAAMQSGSSAQLRTVAEQPINRFDMAEAIQNMMNRLGVKKPSSDKISETRSAIPDYKNIPSAHQQAVEIAYSSGCLTGIDEKGTFSGNSGMTRAQAAVVLIRLDELSRTGTITNTVVEPAPYGDLTEGYWYSPGFRLMVTYFYHFNEDGTYEQIWGNGDVTHGKYEIRDGKLYMLSSSPYPDGEFYYDTAQKKWVSTNWLARTTQPTDANILITEKDTLFRAKYDNFVPLSWLPKLAPAQGVEYKIDSINDPFTKVQDVDAIVTKIKDPRSQHYCLFSVETKQGEIVYSFAIAGEGYSGYDNIKEIYQDDDVLVTKVTVGAMDWHTLCFNKKTGKLKDIPEILTSFESTKNGSLLIGYYEILEPGEPGRITLYTIYGDFVAELVDDKYLPYYHAGKDYIYYAYSDIGPWSTGEYSLHLPFVIWRYNLSTGERQQVYSLTGFIEEMGDGYVKYSKPDSDKVYTAWY